MQTRQTWLRPNRYWWLLTLAIVTIVSVLFMVVAPVVDAVSTVPTTMNFQGRLTNASGTVLPDGNYNMKFRIFTASSGGIATWTEVHDNFGSTGVTLKNGVFSVALGAVTPLSASLFANNPRYFEVEMPTPATATCSTSGCASFTEGAMTPRSLISASAYAFNSETLDNIDSSEFAQLSGTNSFTGANTIQSGGTLLLKSNAANSLQVTKSAGTNLFNVDTTSAQLVTVGSTTTDATAILFEVDSYNNGTDPTGNNGDIYYNSSLAKFRCYQASAWTNCIGAGGSPTVQDVYDNSGTPATITTSSGTKGVLVKAGSTFDQVNLFYIQNAAGTEVFSADTTNNRIQIGDTVADTTGTVLVLDTKNNAGDPTGVSGAMYYNSNLAQFRCYRDGDWEPCGTKPIDRGWEINDDFLSGATVVAAASIGNANWVGSAMVAGSCSVWTYNGGGVAPSTDRPGILKFATIATANAGCMIGQGTSGVGTVVLAVGNVIKASAAVASVTTTTNTLRVGAFTSNNIAQSVNSGVWWEADPTQSTTNWRYCYANGTTAVCANGGALAANTFARLEIKINALGSNSSNVDFIMNGTTYNVNGVTVNTSTAVRPSTVCYTQAASIQTCYLDYFQMRGDASAGR